ncbi:hypothetical protein [Paenibacillus sp. FSL H7-0756]|uniref:hypothetical protein n=1 Tax=Paenibacillus sp. FSL H7-0756 TaxID=2954738 RepID=UPI0030F60241
MCAAVSSMFIFLAFLLLPALGGGSCWLPSGAVYGVGLAQLDGAVGSCAGQNGAHGLDGAVSSCAGRSGAPGLDGATRTTGTAPAIVFGFPHT